MPHVCIDMVGEAAGVHVRVLCAWVLYAWVSRRTRGCRGRTFERRGGREDTHVGCRNQNVSRDKIVARWQLHTSWLRCGRGRGRGHGRRRGGD